MGNALILIFIFIANIVSMLLIYHSFDKQIEQNKRLIYTMICVGIMYILILIIYFFSSIGIDKEVTTESKNIITFTFVPVNSIILIPFLLRSFNKRKNKIISEEQLNARAITMLIIGILILVSEFFYFKKIEKNIAEIVEEKKITENATVENQIIENQILENQMAENQEIQNNETNVVNDIVNEMENSINTIK